MATNKKLPKGIYQRSETLWLSFSYRGKRCRESLKLKVTPANIKHASRKKELIDYEIKTGLFNYSSHFPESPSARLYGGRASYSTTVEELKTLWIGIVSPDLATSTVTNYKRKADRIASCLGSYEVSAVKRSLIEQFLATDCHKLANKTKNEYLVILRGMFKLALNDGLIETNPMSGIENRKLVKITPDPFNREEINLICTTKTDRPMEQAMIQFGIWTGLRSSELLAVGWDDLEINWVDRRGYLYVKRARVEGEYKVTKTDSSYRRRVELLTGAFEALEKIKLLTAAFPPITIEVKQSDNRTVFTEEWRPLFRNSYTGEPHNDEQFRDSWWKKHLRKAGVRYRPTNNVRHTYASQLLSTGRISKDWIAMQMGHSTTKMIEERYAKWIPEDTPSMADLVNQAVGFGTNTSHKTRTAS
ncbi:MAG: DUF3596 domain-containing protein [Gammaproteobacteria bacterium]|nr:DUF3596 domain-containing protein [Gammaproteobacteria bacterium]